MEVWYATITHPEQGSGSGFATRSLRRARVSPTVSSGASTSIPTTRRRSPAWPFFAHNDDFKIVGAARALPERMVQVAYEDPDGSRRCCANSEIADMAIELFGKQRGNWRYIDSLMCLRSAHLEFGRRDPFVEVPIAF